MISTLSERSLKPKRKRKKGKDTENTTHIIPDIINLALRPHFLELLLPKPVFSGLAASVEVCGTSIGSYQTLL
jgi:hypothetical protein